MKSPGLLFLYLGLVFWLSPSALLTAADKAPVKVFLLLGQSNMQGKGSMGHLKEFSGNVAAVPTAPFWDPEPHGDGGYHYNGSASFFYDAGVAFGEAMLELLPKKEEVRRSSLPEKHTFRSGDGTKSFEATLLRYDADSGLVTVRRADRSTIKFKIDTLSEDDQKYVKDR